MKNKILTILAMLMLLSISSFTKEKNVNKTDHLPQGSINVISSPDLFEMTNKWANVYCMLNTGVKINVLRVNVSNISDFTNTGANIGFISSKYYSAFNNESLWKIVVGRDIIVPIISSKNPYNKEINEKGISPKDLALIFGNTEKKNWGSLLKNEQKEPVNFYMINDESVKMTISNFINLNQNTVDGINIESGSDLIKKIQSDPYAIGFCKISNIIDLNGQNLVDNIKILPIDNNGNGILDYKEKIYDDLHSFLRGVWIGKYSKSLCRNVYSISSIKPTNEVEIGFLKWVLTDGQKYLISFGYSDLVYSERQSQLTNLSDTVIYSKPKNNISVIPKLAIIILLSFIAILFILDSFSRYIKSKKTDILESGSSFPSGFNESSVKIPMGLYYDKTHTWAFMERDGFIKVGIDDFLQHITGTLTQVKMKNPGDKIKKGEQLFSIIQKGKQLDIYAPVSGTIIAQNEQLISNSSKINSSPFSEGWVYTIEPTNWLRDIQFLFMSEIYKEWLKKEFSRLKDFLAFSVKSQKLEYAQIILQDGGDLRDKVLEDLGPEVWEDFQTNFIDTFK